MRMLQKKISQSLRKCKGGFGIMEVLVAAVVLGFMYMAVLELQKGNHEAFLRIRGRDGAVEVAQQVLDSLKRVGIAAIPSSEDEETVINLEQISRSWERGLGGTATVVYTPTVTVQPTADYTAESGSNFKTVQHIYAKQVNVKIEWNFKGSTQSIDVSGVIK